ncbi:dTDP-glucose 4,6-dehydratase [Desulfofustis glycolicus]|uniref:dTDP-glucose 4,6-dehydratase n=1 Tax=Desulfofustis glycolicus DSM 9705 TaxID=1121409 RepID=A0A1M5VR69_9BACT|nr:dTDP-glucose 4,6-dehydratase [Desulfofustis glycolicus]MCB2216778.1 dTDP-glucose 4,6-dehydratase [Desulfobulbaceae bacterium]SHH77668.1 dTDP-glucose 4,6-dehydratase [Desulfofustis glycolicus DSM 9705]
MEKRIVLVTGGCGFIGCNFVRLVRQRLPQWRVINLDKLTYAGNLQSLADLPEGDEYRFVLGDISDRALVARLFAEEAIDTVVHFAAESHVDRSIVGPDEFIATNIGGTFSLLQAAREQWAKAPTADGASRRFLHVSTDEVYGSLGETGLFSETTAYDPRSPYSASKAASDHLVSAYFHTYGLPTLVTNCSNNYGPYQFPEKLIPLVFNNALHGRELPVYGDGKNVRDWLYVTDHCEALLAVLERGEPGRRYNIGGNNEMTNIEVVSLLCDILDDRVGPLSEGSHRRSLITYVRDRQGHDRRYAIDATRIRDEIGWQPSVVRFADGLAATVDWYLTHRDWLEAVIDGSYQDYYREMYG